LTLEESVRTIKSFGEVGLETCLVRIIMARAKRTLEAARFQPGAKVRVRYGVIVPDLPDIPLGGWSGTVTEIIKDHGQINCVFKLDDRTLASIHPIYRRRCERDGLDFETMGLSKGAGCSMTAHEDRM